MLLLDVSLDSPVLSKDDIDVVSTELDGVVTYTSQIPNEKLKSRSYTGIPAPSTVPLLNPLKPIFPTVVDPVQSQMFAALQALKVLAF